MSGEWDRVGAFLEGYIECALWSSNDPETETPLDDKYDIGDVDPDLKAHMRQTCADFIYANARDLERFVELTGRDWSSMGHDLWLTRNGHGAGYWDRYMEAATPQARSDAKLVGERLSEAARALGPFDIIGSGEQVVRM